MGKRAKIVRQDPALALMSIVRSAPHRRAARGLDVRQAFDGTELRVLGPYYLTDLDQTVLLVLLYLARAGQQLNSGDPAHAALEPRGAAETFEQWSYRSTFSRLAREVYSYEPGGEQYAELRESVDRLRAVVVIARVGDSSADSRLLSVAAEGDSLRVTLCWRLAQVLAGGQYAGVDLAERRNLGSATARILHAYLSGSLRAGESVMIASLDTLAERVYGQPSADAARRKRRQRARTALNEIGQLDGWRVKWEGHGVWVTRARRLGHTSAANESRHHGVEVTKARRLGHGTIDTNYSNTTTTADRGGNDFHTQGLDWSALSALTDDYKALIDENIRRCVPGRQQDVLDEVAGNVQNKTARNPASLARKFIQLANTGDFKIEKGLAIRAARAARKKREKDCLAARAAAATAKKPDPSVVTKNISRLREIIS